MIDNVQPRGRGVHLRRVTQLQPAIAWSFLLTLLLIVECGAADLFVSPFGTGVVPFATWDAAATNIQDAINAASAGDTVWVTNGVYKSGGKVMAGDLSNRVALDKALTVQSVNGPMFTFIQGAGPVGASAVRCAWLTNGALLQGFTLTGGATRTGGDIVTLTRGGGVWCTSNAIVANCLISSNSAWNDAGGAYRGRFNSCAINSNTVGTSGGAGGALACVLVNCTVLSNRFNGVVQSSLTNCIVYYTQGNSAPNVTSSTLSYCCTTPLAAGEGNFTSAPQVLPDSIHLANSSPCRGAGTNIALGSDLDGKPWGAPPSVGCAEWQPVPVVGAPPKIRLTAEPLGFAISVLASGQDPISCYWLKEGVIIPDDSRHSSGGTTNLQINHINLLNAGNYQVVLSNSFGSATSAIVSLVIHCADVASTNPVPPYLSWSTAATNIQDAVDAALPGEVVLVAGGIYATGGKPAGGSTNLSRVVVDKPILLQSVNGAKAAIIEGAWDPSTTNGPLAVRCAWLTNSPILGGFVLRNGATQPYVAFSDPRQMGGGLWSASNNCVVVNCVFSNNVALDSGGGAYRTTLLYCTLAGNRAGNYGSPGAAGNNGGGAANCNLKNCLLIGNHSLSQGGGTYNSFLTNCAVIRNSGYGDGSGCSGGTLLNCTVAANYMLQGSTSHGTAVYNANLNNCISYGNYWVGTTGNTNQLNYYNCILTYCCTTPLPVGVGNINADPQLQGDGVHVAATSPCRGAGMASYVLGSDLDGQPWATPPSIGCDEWLPAPVLTFPPTVNIASYPLALDFRSFAAQGQEPLTYFWLKDGVLLADSTHFSDSQTTDLKVHDFEPSDAGFYELVASNSFGMATGPVAQVVIHCANPAATTPSPPYSDWTTAASTLQDAVDAALSGELVLATNGAYTTGGRIIDGDLSNRVAVTRRVTITSMNGPGLTGIKGAWDPVSTNGPLAVRGVWLTHGATLCGFTVQDGATRDVGDPYSLGSGGGVWAASSSAQVFNCIITNSAANYGGGGAYGAQLNRCLVVGNRGTYGGGTYLAPCLNSFILRNRATQQGGGAYDGNLTNCTILFNSASSSGGGWYGYNFPTARNCTIYANSGLNTVNNWSGSATFANCCSSPLPSGIGNVSLDPQILDGPHVAISSPCRGAGSALYSSGTDFDGEPWSNPPSIGCDEVWETNLVGPLTVSLQANGPVVVQGRIASLSGAFTGRATRTILDLGDGSMLTNVLSFVRTWPAVGDYTVTFTVFNSDNPNGVSATVLLHVVPLNAPKVTALGVGTNGFSLSFPGQPGISYFVEQTTNLNPPVSWQSVTRLFSTGQVMQATDPNATNAARFYRLRTQ